MFFFFCSCSAVLPSPHASHRPPIPILTRSGHCKSLAPVYEKVAQSVVGENVVVANCDADKFRELGERYGVTGFPTLKWSVFLYMSL